MIHYYLFHTLNHQAFILKPRGPFKASLLLTVKQFRSASHYKKVGACCQMHDLIIALIHITISVLIRLIGLVSLNMFDSQSTTDNLQTALAFIPPAEAFQPIERAITKNNTGNRKYTLQGSHKTYIYIPSSLQHPDGTLGGAAGLKQTRIIYETRRPL